ncbi:hypothetical protein MRX96_037703 [Rhipicephalus microplus]
MDCVVLQRPSKTVRVALIRVLAVLRRNGFHFLPLAFAERWLSSRATLPAITHSPRRALQRVGPWARFRSQVPATEAAFVPVCLFWVAATGTVYGGANRTADAAVVYGVLGCKQATNAQCPLRFRISELPHVYTRVHTRRRESNEKRVAGGNAGAITACDKARARGGLECERVIGGVQEEL